MEQLKLYITLIRHNCVTIANQALQELLQELHNSNQVFFYDKDSSTIYIDGNWWYDFIHLHTPDMYETILLRLRARFKANYIHLVSKNAPIARFTWNYNEKMYL